MKLISKNYLEKVSNSIQSNLEFILFSSKFKIGNKGEIGTSLDELINRPDLLTPSRLQKTITEIYARIEQWERRLSVQSIEIDWKVQFEGKQNKNRNKILIILIKGRIKSLAQIKTQTFTLIPEEHYNIELS